MQLTHGLIIVLQSTAAHAVRCSSYSLFSSGIRVVEDGSIAICLEVIGQLFLSFIAALRFGLSRRQYARGVNAGPLTCRWDPSYSQRSIFPRLPSEKYSFSAPWSMVSPFGVTMSEPTITWMPLPASVDRKILGCCSFQLVQNIRLRRGRGSWLVRFWPHIGDQRSTERASFIFRIMFIYTYSCRQTKDTGVHNHRQSKVPGKS